MNVIWLVAAGALLLAGPLPGLLLAARGDAPARLIGLLFAGTTTVMVLLAVAMAGGQSSYLIVPLVLAILLPAGTLVFTRLLRQRGRRPGGGTGAGDGPRS